ncbi:MAG: hypothetical protein OES26_21300, partial [Gammaproteobacteria bacterium]|nr:hypothetical protein [Gammaproteobacteria bacterium]
YTLNTFLFFVLFAICYRLAQTSPAGGDRVPNVNRLVPLAAFVYGLSLANHWPLMIVATPALIILAYPARHLFARRVPMSTLCIVLGLLPYVWMVMRSQMDPVTSFLGPITSWQEFWNYVTREHYANVDTSPTATWRDQWQFLLYAGRVTAYQFAIIGAVLAVIGAVDLWRRNSRRLLLSILVGIIGTIGVLLMLVQFDYDQLRQTVFRVYLLVPYALVAMLMGFGFSMVTVKVKFLSAAFPKALIVAVTVALIFATSYSRNQRAGYSWSKEYATTLLNSLPPDADLFVSGDVPTATVGYFHLIEGVRPDVDVYSQGGLVFSNRLFKPSSGGAEIRDSLDRFIDDSSDPVFFTKPYQHTRYPMEHAGLYSRVAAEQTGDRRSAVINESLFQYFRGLRQHKDMSDAWTIVHRQELYKQFGEVVGILERSADTGWLSPIREQVLKNIYGTIGYLTGLMTNKDNAASVMKLGQQMLSLAPRDIQKTDLADLYMVTGWGALQLGGQEESIQYLKQSIEANPRSDNRAIIGLLQIYKQRGDEGALLALKQRFDVRFVGDEKP